MNDTHVRTMVKGLVLALLGSCALFAGDAGATPGDLDTSFGTGGVTTTANGSAEAVAIQADGKIVAAGTGNQSFVLIRYNTDGTPDVAFGNAGVVRTTIGYFCEAHAVTVQGDGKIVVAGRSYGSTYYLTLARYNGDGSLDGTFGSAGIVTLAVGDDSGAHGISIQSDGKIVVAGYSHNAISFVFLLARFNPDGTLDSAFGAAGLASTAIANSAVAQALAIQSDGKIVAAGDSWDGSADTFALARHNSDGSPDLGFGIGGVVTTGVVGIARSVAIQSDGKIVAAGTPYQLVRYNADGTLDATFGGTGIVSTHVAKGEGQAYALAIQSDGKIVAAGTAGTGRYGTNYNFVLSRYGSDGMLDGSFGVGGLAITDVGGPSSSDGVYALAVQNDGKLVAAGYCSNANDVAVARYLP